MRLPNLLQFKQLVEKRRIGMRLPNIIYLRSEPDKKAIWERSEVVVISKEAALDRNGRARREPLHYRRSSFWLYSRIRDTPTSIGLTALRIPTWLPTPTDQRSHYLTEFDETK
ncbi:unnamed protein product [Nippostrongylus brasiliensis]|uniref:Uncharacterized protein n=1 Tax=Nippostrongylus brasiliensis TaxID=27835 RepID=A0A0N4YUR7_NIPBR|nr:unnamed protein product [Nippostrongylus brasiliensis]